jgi:PLP dependent protein
MSIAENLARIADNINVAIATRQQGVSGTGTQVKIVAVTKNQEAEIVRVQEALSKAEILNRQAEWHLIGHLQTNKVRQAVPLFELIHSVDSERLALEIDRVAAKTGKRQDILIQVNAAREDTKYGIEVQAVPDLAKMITGLEHTRLCGLMTIAPFFPNPEDSRPVFKTMYDLFMELKMMKLANCKFEWLSMGMTNDYAVAIEEGANLVRVGTAIFGPRQLTKED